MEFFSGHIKILPQKENTLELLCTLQFNIYDLLIRNNYNLHQTSLSPTRVRVQMQIIVFALQAAKCKYADCDYSLNIHVQGVTGFWKSASEIRVGIPREAYWYL